MKTGKLRVLLYLGIICLLLIGSNGNSYAQADSDNVILDLNDSTQVITFIEKSSVCQQVEYIQKYPDGFVTENKGYGYFLLNSIAKGIKGSIVILGVSHHGKEHTRQEKIDHLLNQMANIYQMNCIEPNESE